MRLIRYILLAVMAAPALMAGAQSSSSGTSKQERLLLKQANELFGQEKFHEALKYYDNALTVNPSSTVALFNKAVTLGQLATDDNKNTENDPRKMAAQIYKDIATADADAEIVAKAFYNLGNMAFNDEDYATAIEMYKGSLRKIPENKKARQNLLLALQKQQEQQQDKQDQNQDQDQQDQQQQQQQQQQQEQQQQQDQQQQQQQQPMTQSAEQILQTMQNRENATRRKVNEEEARPAGRPSTDKPW